MAMADGKSPFFSASAQAANAITQYTAVKLTTGSYENLTCDVATTAVSTTFGIALESAVAGQNCNICVGGITRAIVDGNAGAIAEGDFLMPTTAGTLIKIAVAGSYYIAQAMEDSTAAGDIIRVQVIKGTYYVAP